MKTLRVTPLMATAVCAMMLSLALGSVSAAEPTIKKDRTLKVVVTLDGAQEWKNGIQWTKGKTSQRYEISTALRSDGKLYGANYLHLDTNTRLAIKTEYLRQQGAEKIKEAGLDPHSPQLRQEISRQMQKEIYACEGDSACRGQTNNKWAMIMAAAVAPDNSHIFEQGEPRYLFYFGYPGCKNVIHAQNVIEAEGETGLGQEVKELSPYKLQMRGDSAGTPQEQKSLCEYFSVVIDTIDDKMYVENVNMPSARGTAVRTEFGKTDRRDVEIPNAAPLQAFVNTTLRGPANFSGDARETLSLNLPLDGNSTVLGHFTGEGKASLTWSFE